MKLLSEQNFEIEYKKIIGSFCEFNEKENFFESFDKNKLHYLSYANPSATANVVILHGFSECAKKFDEMAYYFFVNGYNVFSLDLRGHGNSFKPTAPRYGVDISDFSIYADDLEAFFAEIKKESSLPIYLFTHSLGGNVALLGIIEKDLPIKKLVLSSPMICGNTGMPVSVAKSISKAMIALGKGKAPAPGKCIFDPDKPNCDAMSVARANHSTNLKVENVAYQTCGPDFNWVYASIVAARKLVNPFNVDRIKAKMLLIKPDSDARLLESWRDEFISLCEDKRKDIECIKLPNTHHEIFQSRNPELKIYLEKILDFFEN